jgi:geranylgeranyl diphosphate synthase type II
MPNPTAQPDTPLPQAVTILLDAADRITDYLSAFTLAHPDAPAKIIDAVRYSLLAGGKRLRPTLVLECWRACQPAGAELVDLRQAPSSALAAAGAIELIHTFSLVHDDLPAMDNDDLRRGLPTNHKVFGEAIAILAGDAMVSMAFQLIAEQAQPVLVPDLIKELAIATGPAGMIGGQVLDIDPADRPTDLSQLQRLHRMKTGALLTASCRLGALAAGLQPGDPKMTSIDSYGRHLGLTFQIIDDILDVTSTPEQLGKATNKDVAHGKTTYPSLIGLDASRLQAQTELQHALDAVASLGQPADGLRAIARFVVERHS